MKPYLLKEGNIEGMLKRYNKMITEQEKAYIAGFLDGDGCILLQLVKNSDYKYGFTVRTSVCFYQKKTKHWFLIWLRKKFGNGYIIHRNDNMSVYTITGFNDTENVIKTLYPYLIIKKNLAKICLDVISNYRSIETKDDFIKVSMLIDKTSNYTDSKKRINNTDKVIQYLSDL